MSLHKLAVGVILTLGLMFVPGRSDAAPVTFDLRAPAIELIDEVNSFSLEKDGLIATLTAIPTSFAGNSLLLNQTTSGFGINVDNTTCGSAELSDQLDGGCVGESIQVMFNSDVLLNSLWVSSFGSLDKGLVTMGGPTYTIGGTGFHSLSDTFLSAGTPFAVTYTQGNGFSFDKFVATSVSQFSATSVSVPEPSTLMLFSAGAIGLIVGRRSRLKT